MVCCPDPNLLYPLDDPLDDPLFGINHEHPATTNAIAIRFTNCRVVFTREWRRCLYREER